MQTVTVAQLKQNPSGTLNAVEQGQSFVVTRYNRPVGQLIPMSMRRPTTGAEFTEMLRRTPVDAGWAKELQEQRDEFNAECDARWVELGEPL